MAVVIEGRKKKSRAGTAAIVLILLVLLAAGTAGVRAYLLYLDYKAADDAYLGLAARYTGIDVGAAGGWAARDGDGDDLPAEEEDVDRRIPGVAGIDFPDLGIDHAALYELNPDYMGWIWIDDEISDIHISYPFLQGEDNDKYLRTTMEGESNHAGSIFADWNTPADFSEHHTIIYGHNMANGSMFSDLKKYRGTAEQEQERYYYIFLRDGSVLKCRLFSTHVVSKTSTIYQIHMSDALYEEFFPRVLGESEDDWGADGLVPDNIPEKTVTLSTCHGASGTSKRMAVHAYIDTWFVDPEAKIPDLSGDPPSEGVLYEDAIEPDAGGAEHGEEADADGGES